MAAEDYISFDWIDDDEEDEDQIIDYLEIEFETEKARLFVTKRGKLWVPKSVGHTEEGMVLVLPSWFTINYIKDR
jgi:hypothetical protein